MYVDRSKDGKIKACPASDWGKMNAFKFLIFFALVCPIKWGENSCETISVASHHFLLKDGLCHVNFRPKSSFFHDQVQTLLLGICTLHVQLLVALPQLPTLWPGPTLHSSHPTSKCLPDSSVSLRASPTTAPRISVIPEQHIISETFCQPLDTYACKSKYFYLDSSACCSLCPRSESVCVSKTSPTQDAEGKSPHSVSG